jgi:hypothetical protein
MAFTLKCRLITEVIMIALEHLLLCASVIIGRLTAIAIITESLRY